MTRFEKDLAILEEIAFNEKDTERSNAIERALDSVALVQSLWTTLADIGEVKDTGSEPDYEQLVRAIERLNNQLAAAVLLIAALPDQSGIDFLRNSAQRISTECKDHPDSAAVMAIVNGYLTLADKVSGVEATLNVLTPSAD